MSYKQEEVEGKGGAETDDISAEQAAIAAMVKKADELRLKDKERKRRARAAEERMLNAQEPTTLPPTSGQDPDSTPVGHLSEEFDVGKVRENERRRQQAYRATLSEQERAESQAKNTRDHQEARSRMPEQAKEERKKKDKEQKRYQRAAGRQATLKEMESYKYEGGDPPLEVLEGHEHNVHAGLLRLCNGTGRTSV
jgi:hypothetical protein